jgi:hypothetical protein
MSSRGLAKSPKRDAKRHGMNPRCRPVFMGFMRSSRSARLAPGGVKRPAPAVLSWTRRLRFTAHSNHARQPANGCAALTVGVSADDETAASRSAIVGEYQRLLCGTLREAWSQKFRFTEICGTTSFAK